MAEENQDGPGPGLEQLSEAAQAELMDLCGGQFTRLEKLLNEMILSESDSPGPQDQAVNRLMATDAELNQWLTVQPQLLATNSEILLHVAQEEMLKLCAELEMVVSCYKAKTEKLQATRELELKWLEEKKQLFVAASDHAERSRAERVELPAVSMLQDLKDKIQKTKLYQEKLAEILGDVLEKHAPFPVCESSSSSKKKKIVGDDSDQDLISLNKILELLMNKALTTPNDPYVTMDDSFWPPYVEMLLRHGMVVRDHQLHLKIRLETFF